MTSPAQVPLYGRGGIVIGYAKVDPSDLPLVAPYRWHIGSHGYARSNPQQQIVLMHRLLLGLPPGREIQCDHINRDKLDNRRTNLRLVTQAENMQNRPSHKGSSSRFRGVYWRSERQHWEVCHRINGKKFRGGTFTDEQAAGLAAEAWRREHMPFAEPDTALDPILDEEAA